MAGNPAWKKGVSGNPSGRPKVIVSLVELAREHTTAAVETLAEIMGDAEASCSARVSAASALLDRGYGKPPQFSTSDAEEFRRATDMSDDELARIAAGSGDGTPAKTNGSALIN